jgi:hypothetical protein
MDMLPSLPQLTPDDRLWRVDWFGACAFPAMVRSYAQPSIRVILSPVICDPKNNASLLSPDGTDHHEQQEIWITVASLPLLSIGDIWQEGRYVYTPEYQVESFERVRISSATTSFVKAGLSIDGNFLIPLYQHPWHRNHTQSYCVLITMDDGLRLLVPCIEVIRFYFGSSSNFIQRLFTTQLNAESLWTKKNFDPVKRHLHIVLGRRMSGASASDIGRIAESQFAWRSAAGIHASCQKANGHRQPVYPYTGFPFEGLTKLVASGKWLSFGSRRKATFLVYQLRSCSHPFPFQSLSYEAADRKVSYSRSVGDDDSHARKRGSYKRSETKSEAVDADPGTKKEKRSTYINSKHKFPDLTRKSVWREKIEAMPKADTFLRKADGTLEQVAFGEGDRCVGVTGVDAIEASEEVQVKEAEKPQEMPHFVKVGLRQISSLEQIVNDTHIKLVCVPGKTEPVFSLPIVVDENGEIPDSLLFTAVDGSVRQRRGCFVEVLGEDAQEKYLLIVEERERGGKPEILLAVQPNLAESVRFVEMIQNSVAAAQSD